MPTYNLEKPSYPLNITIKIMKLMGNKKSAIGQLNLLVVVTCILAENCISHSKLIT